MPAADSAALRIEWACDVRDGKQLAASDLEVRDCLACVPTTATDNAPALGSSIPSDPQGDDVNVNAPPFDPKRGSVSPGSSEALTANPEIAEPIVTAQPVATPPAAEPAVSVSSKPSSANHISTTSLDDHAPSASAATVKAPQPSSEARSPDPAAVGTREAAVAMMAVDPGPAIPVEPLANSSDTPAAKPLSSVRPPAGRTASTRLAAGAHTTASTNSTLSRSRHNVQPNGDVGPRAIGSAIPFATATDTDAENPGDDPSSDSSSAPLVTVDLPSAPAQDRAHHQSRHWHRKDHIRRRPSIRAGGPTTLLPRRRTTAWPPDSRMFSGLMSRWTTPCRWA